MKWTPQNTTNSASLGGGGQPGQPERVAPGVRPAHHLVPLVVVAEDQQPGPEGGLGGGDAARQILGGCIGIAPREGRLEPKH